MSGRRIAIREHGALHSIGVGISIGLFGLVLLVGALVIGLPLVTGSTPMTVLTSSMSPTYPPGTLIIVKPTPVDEIRIGDAITFQRESGKADLVTHRVVSIESTNGEQRFVTQGDNNGAPDEKTVHAVQVRGTVWYSVPWIGYVNTIVNGENRAIIVPVVAVALFLYAGFMFASGIASYRSKHRPPETGSTDAIEGHAPLA